MEGINWFDLILCVFIAIVIENILGVGTAGIVGFTFIGFVYIQSKK
jgi:hypothetical protein